ncbi:hypothetical protein O1L60_37060 [Streptomyces diastatochromogenes]|nr:hypothetical protein [Streptomyces diastatochromogenes]
MDARLPGPHGGPQGRQGTARPGAAAVLPRPGDPRDPPADRRGPAVPGSDEVADDRARAAYRTRLDRLDEEIADARAGDDRPGSPVPRRNATS